MSDFREKLSETRKKSVKNMMEDSRSLRSTLAFTEELMYDDTEGVKRVFQESGVYETYRSTTQYDNDWN